MSIATAVSISPGAVADMPFPLTIDVFDQMIEAGLLPPDRRVYLLGGRLFEKMAKTMVHGSVGAAVTQTIVRCLPEGWSLWPESTILLDPANAPLPDFALIRTGDLMGRVQPERYPGPGDVGLLIEIAVTSLRDDLTTGLDLYARAGISAYWVIDVLGRRILAHGEPRVSTGRAEYTRLTIYRSGDTIPLVLDGAEVARIAFDDLLR